MATDLATRPMTTAEFLELADEEGVTRELIDGTLVEREVTIGTPKRCFAIARIGTAISNWLDSHLEIVGTVAGGEVRCRLATDPDLIVGIDIVYYEGEKYERQADEQSFFDGPPVIAVEVLSPSDKHEEIVEKIRRYLSAGVKQVSIADPDLRNVTVHRIGQGAALFNAGDELTGDPELPGFRVRVEKLLSSRRN